MAMNKILFSTLFLICFPLFAAQDTLAISINIEDVMSIDESQLPTEFKIHTPSPNPFNPVVNLQIDVPAQIHASILIYDLAGRNIGKLFEGVLEPGYRQFQWNASHMSSGMYFISVNIGVERSVQKVMLVK